MEKQQKKQKFRSTGEPKNMPLRMIRKPINEITALKNTMTEI